MLDLFNPIVSEDQQHPHFKNITKPGVWSTEKDVLNSWLEGFEDRDGKFVKEFQTTFNSSFWELYLFAVFKELNLGLNFNYSTPDFVFTASSKFGVAEAVIASHPNNFRPEWEFDLSNLMNQEIKFSEFLRLSTIRLANSIQKKYKKYINHYSTLDHVKNKPFILCIAPFEQPLFVDQNLQPILRVLYALDKPIIVNDQFLGYTQYPNIQKKPGTDIELGYFTKPIMPEISAIIFSTTATAGKVRALASPSGESNPIINFSAMRFSERTRYPYLIQEKQGNYNETLLDGLNIFVNPFATAPINLSVFQGREVAIHQYNPNNEEYLPYVSDGFLIHRTCHVVFSYENIDEIDKKTKNNNQKYEEMPPLQWPEGELNYVGGHTYLFSENYMMHYKDWTILISFECIDEEWTSQALKGSFFSHSEYMSVNQTSQDKDGFIVLPHPWPKTKEEAVESMKKLIDHFPNT